ncbi:hypothetical protein ASE74_13430 [Pedobacter sp. Leaf216]|uniref:DUF72 domain-containing protein n=1 Tax=Pedobacter sp. Leaf216 TaxID=1735684 RepID=UPI0006FD9CF8|nr:DUF72 domain-containing protein [Pedobacter sp. Leaf216]KQM78500.1 hypothetical protein ASE74_13430 [Pedobacter sp. Leaf216]
MTNQFTNSFYTGTSGLLLPVPNKAFYPEEFKEKSRLCYYASLMNSIEINSSFYKIPMASTIKKWAQDVPEDFRFTFKLFKGITHNPQLGFDPSDVYRFMEVISNVADKKGSILVQFPPSVRIAQIGQLMRLMDVLSDCNDQKRWNIAFEFRHQSLYIQQVLDLLQDHGFGLVIHDKGNETGIFDALQSDFRYVRFHGPGGNYRGSYQDDLLWEYAGYINEWIAENKTVYVYFNNTMGNAIDNLNTLNRFVGDFLS